MPQTASAHSTTGRTLRSAVIGLVVVVAIIGTLADLWGTSQRLRFPEPPAVGGRVGSAGSVPASPRPFREATPELGAVTRGDGALPGGVTVFDDRYPGIANLEPELLRALKAATADAAADGVELSVTSGWRSPAYQDQLLREAIARYGSAAEAARWVATAATSPHVSGDAVDLGPDDAVAWLSEHGARYGLCQIYGNEPWHYELRPQAVDGRCPNLYADSSQDPRLR